MKKRDIENQITEKIRLEIDSNFWTPLSDEAFRADYDEFQRLFGLMPELAEAIGVRQFLREDTLKSVN
jgi:hypothetical protein